MAKTEHWQLEWLHNHTITWRSKPWSCRLGLHGCLTRGDDFFLWGECAGCGMRFGYILRETVMRAAMANEPK